MEKKEIFRLCLEACTADVLVGCFEATGVSARWAAMPTHASHWQLITQIYSNKNQPGKVRKRRVSMTDRGSRLERGKLHINKGKNG